MELLQRALPIFGWAANTFGISPHSSLTFISILPFDQSGGNFPCQISLGCCILLALQAVFQFQHFVSAQEKPNLRVWAQL